MKVGRICLDNESFNFKNKSANSKEHSKFIELFLPQKIGGHNR